MQKYSKYAKIALVTVISLTLATIVQSAGVGKLNSNTDMVRPRSYSSVEEASSKNLKKTAKATENATEKATKKAAVKTKAKAKVKATEKATEKPTEKTVKKAKTQAKAKAKAKTTATEKATEKPTAAPTEAPTQLVTEAPTVSATEVCTIPTELPTEWSQELQNNYDAQYNAGYLVAIDNPDYTYQTGQVILSKEDKELACQIVYGEAGGEGFEGCCLVAQCLKDSMVFLGYNSVADVRKYCRYDGWQKNYSETAKQAVEYIFDQNRSAVAHRLLFFYAPNLCKSDWHESQYFVLQRGNSRFFDMY